MQKQYQENRIATSTPGHPTVAMHAVTLVAVIEYHVAILCPVVSLLILLLLLLPARQLTPVAHV